MYFFKVAIFTLLSLTNKKCIVWEKPPCLMDLFCDLISPCKKPYYKPSFCKSALLIFVHNRSKSLLKVCREVNPRASVFKGDGMHIRLLWKMLQKMTRITVIVQISCWTNNAVLGRPLFYVRVLLLLHENQNKLSYSKVLTCALCAGDGSHPEENSWGQKWI